MKYFATLPMPEPPRARKRCKHAWVTTHEASHGWTVSGYTIRQTCTGCGAATAVDRATHDAYVQSHHLNQGRP